MDDQGPRHVADLEQELSTVRLRITQEEQRLESTRDRLDAFAQIYARTISERLDQLRTLQAGRIPPGASTGLIGPEDLVAADPSTGQDELQRLYRQSAQRIHPDLAQDQAERLLRTKVMAEFNAAREARDLDRTRQLVEDWEVRPQTILRDSDTARAAHLVRTIQRARVRLVAIAEEHDRLRRSNLHVLLRIVEARRTSGVDMLAEMAADLDRQLAGERVAATAPMPRETIAAPLPPEAIGTALDPEPLSRPLLARTIRAHADDPNTPAPRAPRRPKIVTLLWPSGAAVAALVLVGAAGASLLSAPHDVVVLLPSTRDRITPAPTAPPADATPAALSYQLVDRTTAAADRSTTTVRIVIDGAASRGVVVSTLAAAARRELRSSQVVVIYAYRSAAEGFGPFTVGRAYLSADGRGWSGDGLTEDGPDDGGIVGSVVTALGGSIETAPFRAPR